MNHQHFYFYDIKKHGPRMVEPVATGLDTNLMGEHREMAGYADYSRRNDTYIPEPAYATIGYLDGEARWWRSDENGNLLDWCRVEVGFEDVIYTMGMELGEKDGMLFHLVDGVRYTVRNGKWTELGEGWAGATELCPALMLWQFDLPQSYPVTGMHGEKLLFSPNCCPSCPDFVPGHKNCPIHTVDGITYGNVPYGPPPITHEE